MRAAARLGTARLFSLFHCFAILFVCLFKNPLLLSCADVRNQVGVSAAVES